MSKISRRSILAAGTAGGVVATTAAAHAAGVFGNPDLPPQGAINASAAALSDPGPQYPPLADNEPPFLNPPPTDIGNIPQFWSSFNLSPKRVQAGGWARQVNTGMFPISKDIAGVNMRLAAGGIRELHWHQQAEWAVMTYGYCRVTTLDTEGRPYVADVKAGDLWYFPAGLPHSLQGLGPDGAEFVLAFDNGAAGEFNTLLVYRLVGAYAARSVGEEFRRARRCVQEHPAAAALDLPGQSAWPARRRSAGDRGGRPARRLIRSSSRSPT